MLAFSEAPDSDTPFLIYGVPAKDPNMTWSGRSCEKRAGL